MTEQPIELGEIQGVKITAERSVVWASLLLWFVFSLLGLRVWRLKPSAAVAGGVLATALHFLSELWHQMGHARAARQTEFPMTGVHLYTALGASVYPPDEPSLPGSIHVARALGGPQASLLMTVAAGLLAALAWPLRSVVSMITTIFALDNLLIFTLGALLPLPFMETDGTVLLKYGHRLRRAIVLQE